MFVTARGVASVHVLFWSVPPSIPVPVPDLPTHKQFRTAWWSTRRDPSLIQLCIPSGTINHGPFPSARAAGRALAGTIGAAAAAVRYCILDQMFCPDLGLSCFCPWVEADGVLRGRGVVVSVHVSKPQRFGLEGGEVSSCSNARTIRPVTNCSDRTAEPPVAPQPCPPWNIPCVPLVRYCSPPHPPGLFACRAVPMSLSAELNS